MKNKTLLYLLLLGGAVLLISATKKKSGYSIDIPEPEKITEEEFNKPKPKRLIDIPKTITKEKIEAVKRILKIQGRRGQIKGFPDTF